MRRLGYCATVKMFWWSYRGQPATRTRPSLGLLIHAPLGAAWAVKILQKGGVQPGYAVPTARFLTFNKNALQTSRSSVREYEPVGTT